MGQTDQSSMKMSSLKGMKLLDLIPITGGNLIEFEGKTINNRYNIIDLYYMTETGPIFNAYDLKLQTNALIKMCENLD